MHFQPIQKNWLEHNRPGPPIAKQFDQEQDLVRLRPSPPLLPFMAATLCWRSRLSGFNFGTAHGKRTLVQKGPRNNGRGNDWCIQGAK